MKDKMKKLEMGSVFKKLYLLFIAMIASIYACAIIIFLLYAYLQRKEELSAMQAMVRQSAATLREQLSIVSNLERNLLSDSRVMDLSQDTGLDAYQQSQLVAGLVGSLKSNRSMNHIVEEISILFPAKEMEISASEGMSRKKCVPASRKEGDTARSLVYVDGQVQMELWYPLTISIEEDYLPDYGVRVTLAESYLGELLGLFAMGEQGGGFSVLSTGEGLRQIPEGEEAGAGAGTEAERVGTEGAGTEGAGAGTEAEETGTEETGTEEAGAEAGEKGLMEGWRQAFEKAGSGGSFLGNGSCRGKRYLFISEEIPEYGVTLVAYRSSRWIDASTVMALLVMGGVILLVGGMFLLMLFQTYAIVNKPLQKVVQAFGKVQEGDLSIRITHKYQDEFQYIYSAFNKMVERIGELIENVKEQGRLLQNAELIQLQSQINPHFLYNSFYLIRIMAKNESYEQITHFVTSLAKYYRFLNKEAEQNIPLSREEEHMGNYMDIQQMRFGDKITVHRDAVPKEAASFRVPKLILQPIMENAYNYGMADILQDGQISVSYEIAEPFLYIMIEDNGGGGSPENLEKMRAYIKDYQGRAAGHALSNIDRRLKLAYGEDSGILLEKSRLGGLKVILKLDMSVQL